VQDIRIYILIENKDNDAEVRIDGNLETLRELLYVIRAEITPVAAISAEDWKQNKRGTHGIH
jgi:hypothetical protein